MKLQKTVMSLIIVLFVMTLAGIGAGAYFYKQYREKVDYFEQQNQYTQAQLRGMEQTLDKFKISLEGLHSKFKEFVNNLNTMEGEWKEFTSRNAEGNQQILVSIDTMRTQIEAWQSEYSNSLRTLQETLTNLKNQIGMAQEGAKHVELGEIAVEK